MVAVVGEQAQPAGTFIAKQFDSFNMSCGKGSTSVLYGRLMGEFVLPANEAFLRVGSIIDIVSQSYDRRSVPK